ncbi:hypothetical protein BDFG_08901 [Blastomyces dermatitidis ATCC 26199]|nr:hypothetical protein BDFG_08901 [Blastomyces dermatitidis ATCC 26199]
MARSEVIPTSLRDSDSESNLMKAQKDQKQITILYCLEWRIISPAECHVKYDPRPNKKIGSLGALLNAKQGGERPKHVNNDNIEMWKD